MRKSVVLFFLILVLVFGVFNSQVLAENKVVIGISEEPNTLDVQGSGANITNSVGSFIGSPLIAQDPETLDFVPCIAKSWEVSEDGLVWTFNLREDVKFHNGEPLTAEDYKYTFNRAKTKGGVSASKLEYVEEIEVIDDYTFKLHLSKPFAPMMQSLTSSGWLQPISKKAVEEFGEDYGQNPVSIGPFKFKEWNSGESITLVKNEDFDWAASFYENQGPPYIEELVFEVIPEASTSMAALETGQIDITLLEDKDVTRFENYDNFYILNRMRLGIGLFVIMNIEKEPLDSLAVRKAINYAINKNSIIQIAKNGNAVPAYGPIPPSFWGYDKEVEEYGYKFNTEKAKEILEEAGWIDNDGNGIREKDGKELSFKLQTQPVSDWTQAAQIIQDQLKTIGIEMEIQQYEWGTLLDSLNNGNHDLALMGYTYNGPDVLYLFLHSSQIDGGINWSFARDDTLDTLIETGRTTTNTEERFEVYKELQKYIVDEAIWAPIYIDLRYNAVNKRVQNVKMHPLKWFILQDAKVIEE